MITPADSISTMTRTEIPNLSEGDERRHLAYVTERIHSFDDPQSENHLVHDWRAPVSSMLYHYETGPAEYEAPEGRVDGEVLLKRQFRIEQGKMEFMLETAMNIHGDVLQR